MESKESKPHYKWERLGKNSLYPQVFLHKIVNKMQRMIVGLKGLLGLDVCLFCYLELLFCYLLCFGYHHSLDMEIQGI